jgi:hypothetical protein
LRIDNRQSSGTAFSGNRVELGMRRSAKATEILDDGRRRDHGHHRFNREVAEIKIKSLSPELMTSL